VIVMNTPGGNTISTAEHAFSLLLSVARKIPQAHANLQSGKWDRKHFEGTELYNKTLGIIGMGRIGSELSRRAIAFGMRVLAYDPYLSSSRARSLQVELVEELGELLPLADFLTLHRPLTAETHHLLNAARLTKTKRGVRLINCARGGLIDEAALIAALTNGQVWRGSRRFRNRTAPVRFALARNSEPYPHPASWRLDLGGTGKCRDRDRAGDPRRAPRRNDSQRH
jgi:D-3-phosphoglycerate dehydrogenase